MVNVDCEVIDTFVNTHSFSERKKFVDSAKTKHPGHFPIIVGVDQKCSTILRLTREKFMMPLCENWPFLKRHFQNKPNIKSNYLSSINPHQAVFLMSFKPDVPSEQPIHLAFPDCQNLGEIYEKIKNTDGMVYIVITLENVFGLTL